jgi:hypothetical protein
VQPLRVQWRWGAAGAVPIWDSGDIEIRILSSLAETSFISADDKGAGYISVCVPTRHRMVG